VETYAEAVKRGDAVTPKLVNPAKSTSPPPPASRKKPEQQQQQQQQQQQKAKIEVDAKDLAAIQAFLKSKNNAHRIL